jgi:hypothetical protein
MASEAKEVDVAAPAAATEKPVEETAVVPETNAELAKEEATPALNGNGNHAVQSEAVLEKDLEGQKVGSQKVCFVASLTAGFD